MGVVTMYLNIVMCAVSIQYICLSNSRLPLLRLCNSKKIEDSDCADC